MLPRYIWIFFVLFFLVYPGPIGASEPAGEVPPKQASSTSQQALSTEQKSLEETLALLTSLAELQHNLQEQMALTRKKIRVSTSDSAKERLKVELARLDRQLSDSSNDFERIATGIEIGLFIEKKPETFNWKDEIATLVEPTIHELKRLTIRARQKTKLKDTITEFSRIAPIAAEAVQQLERLNETTTNPAIKRTTRELLPEWRNTENRIRNKLELAQLELSQMEDQEVSLVESSSKVVRNFFRDRGFYLFIALAAFGSIILVGRLFYRILFRFLPYAKQDKRAFHIRLLDLILRVATVALAVLGLFLVLYQAEDWFLLSMAIVFFLGLVWTVRQTIPRLWQQGRLMLNVGSVRERERIIMHGVPWKVETLHVFCILFNPTLGLRIRVPIEHIVGMVSRPYSHDEPWFPCKQGDWVVLGDRPRARVVSLSHEQVETVERGGKRYFYQTADFLGLNPINLSRNFRLRVVFGISYDLQAQATSTIPQTLKSFIQGKLEEEGYGGSCLNLLVEFKEAGSSSLDLQILADFKGEVADIYARLERAIQRWCVDAATRYNWEIPFPQLCFHWPAKEKEFGENRQEHENHELPSTAQ